MRVKSLKTSRKALLFLADRLPFRRSGGAGAAHYWLARERWISTAHRSPSFWANAGGNDEKRVLGEMRQGGISWLR